jgi:hypothetical protein
LCADCKVAVIYSYSSVTVTLVTAHLTAHAPDSYQLSIREPIAAFSLTSLTLSHARSGIANFPFLFLHYAEELSQSPHSHFAARASPQYFNRLSISFAIVKMQALAIPSPVTSPPTRSLHSKSRFQGKPLPTAKDATQMQRRAKKVDSKPQIDPMERLRYNLSRFTRTNDRRMMIRTLKDSSMLRIIALNALDHNLPASQEWINVEHEVATTELIVNGVPIGPKVAAKDLLKRPNREQLAVLKKLCHHLVTAAAAATVERVEKDPVVDAHEVYSQLVARLARTPASADAYFTLNSILGCADLVLQPPKKCQPMLADLSIYQSSGVIHAVTTTRHPYGLFRKSDLAPSNVGGTKRPWIRILAVVVERINLTTGESARHCSVQLQEK